MAVSETENSAGGQASSARDLLKLASHILSHESNATFLTSSTIDEWLRPIHVWADGYTQVGLPWEIYRLPDYTSNNGGTFDLYTKSGNLPGFNTIFALDRAAGNSIIILSTGNYSVDSLAVSIATEYMHPAFQNAEVQAINETYTGLYGSGDNEAVVSFGNGTLWVDKLVVNGANILEEFGSGVDQGSVALWTTGRQNEFRYIFVSCFSFQCLRTAQTSIRRSRSRKRWMFPILGLSGHSTCQ